MTNTGNRLIIGILSLGYVLLSIFFLTMLIFGWPVPFGSLQYYLSDISTRWILGLIMTALFFIAMFFLLKSFGSRPVKFSVLHETDLGLVNITLSALEQLVLKGSSNVSGVREVKPSLKLTADGISLLLKVQVIPDIHIPQVTSDLQKTVKDYLMRTTGTSLNEIKVQVTKITTDIRTPKISRVE